MKNKSILLLGLLVAAAAVMFVSQTTSGLSVTGLHEPVVWGAYVVCFTFFVGAGAGILLILSFCMFREDIDIFFKLRLAFSAFVTLGLAGVFVILDLGRIDRFYYMIIHPQIKSPLFWDFVAMNSLMIVSAAFCFVFLRNVFSEKQLSENPCLCERLICKITSFKKEIKAPPVLSKIAAPIVLIIVLVAYILTTHVFTHSTTHPIWNSPLLSVIFLLSSIVTAFAIVLLIDNRGSDKGVIFSNTSIKRLLMLSLFAELILVIVKYKLDINNPLIENIPSLFPFSLLVFLIAGTVLPAVLLIIAGKSCVVSHKIVPVLVILGVLFRRAETIIPAYYQRWLPFPSGVSYMPTITEVLIILGVCSAGIIALIISFNCVSSKNLIEEMK